MLLLPTYKQLNTDMYARTVHRCSLGLGWAVRPCLQVVSMHQCVRCQRVARLQQNTFHRVARADSNIQPPSAYAPLRSSSLFTAACILSPPQHCTNCSPVSYMSHLVSGNPRRMSDVMAQTSHPCLMSSRETWFRCGTHHRPPLCQTRSRPSQATVSGGMGSLWS